MMRFWDDCSVLQAGHRLFVRPPLGTIVFCPNYLLLPFPEEYVVRDLGLSAQLKEKETLISYNREEGVTPPATSAIAAECRHGA